MTWVRLSDKKHRDEALRSSGPLGKVLWLNALGECAAFDEGAGRDGVLSPMMVRDAAMIEEPPLPADELAPLLVEQGVWHTARSARRCKVCVERGLPKLAADAYLIHEWWEHLLSSAGKHDGVVRDHERRGKRLDRHPELTAMVRRRDRDLCRYCGVLCNFRNRRGKQGGTYDHVDPFGGNSLANVVVACRYCNGVKKDRTPEQAGMVLLPEPVYLATDLATGVDPGQNDLALARETGPGQNGLDPVLTTGLDSGLDLALVSNGHSNGNGTKGEGQ